MDILEEIRKNQREISTLMQRICDSRNQPAWSRLLNDLIVALISHHASKEKFLFRKLKTAANARRYCAKNTSEHISILNQLYALNDTSDNFNHQDTIAACETIRQQLDKRFAEENEQLFPLFRIAVATERTDTANGHRDAYRTAEHHATIKAEHLSMSI